MTSAALTVEQTPPPVPAADMSSPATMLAVIERVATDPNADIDKMERLLQMHERMLEREARAAYTSAMAAMQPELPSIVERGKIKNNSGNVTSTYALWEDINAAIKPILQKHGFALSFRTETGDDSVHVVGILAHRAGHQETTEITLPADKTGSKNSVQAVGSSVSYGKRYTAGSLLNITTHGEDDDGRLGGGALDAKAIDWIDKANELAELEKYQPLREAMLKDYGGKASNMPAEVRNAFNRAKARVTPKD
ncbi:ERF family protein [Lysobacter korlensis]|uniref:ERF family protein n=1 Tax=Lysobacter korlensis TaxID=553636 RepID=A0ABV6RKH8_9GAMM